MSHESPLPNDVPEQPTGEIASDDCSSDAHIATLCQQLKQSAARHRGVADWPWTSLSMCARKGVCRWFLPTDQGGLGYNAVEQTLGYLRLAQADLVTTFVITQWVGAIKRIAGSENRFASDRWLPSLLAGNQFATVGISHLTTSGRHLDQPPMRVEMHSSSVVLSGVVPWVTGAAYADLIVVGAVTGDGEQVLVAVPTNLAGVSAGQGAELIALSASCTDKVRFNQVNVDRRYVLAGPIDNVLSSGSGGTAGGLQTSTLALGLAYAALEYLQEESMRRQDLVQPTSQLTKEANELKFQLLAAVAGETQCDAGQLRGSANSLVMRATQAAMMAAKGAGFVEGHPVGRWCRQALFFLVWSCPQPVAQAHLCELARIAQ
ncbi:acyl-CoA/acyl-ACP dehydrogenase [Stieleria varia]|uniref:Acyl-CoA dehydrogenase n=1 Tax=Stieleria varia TaxID=2528005 RepID=A0A5C6AUX0_9BACT|nr:acyl-CoA/acyl-ACP dehydrogenase [Stieleria varia]TWU02822.1 hypothetical protein Pla52n_38820 [Stieleria varia]